MSEGLSSHPEQLSNRRFMYEAFVTALRRVSIRDGDKHYIKGNTLDGGPFQIDDYFHPELIDEDIAAPSERGMEACDRILDSRRTVITISGQNPDTNGLRRSYFMVYPEDLKSRGNLISGLVHSQLPTDWPPNEPFILQSIYEGRSLTPQYRIIEEPFQEPDLAAIYAAVAANL